MGICARPGSRWARLGHADFAGNRSLNRQLFKLNFELPQGGEKLPTRIRLATELGESGQCFALEDSSPLGACVIVIYE
jgi:hypothetical protein